MLGPLVIPSGGPRLPIEVWLLYREEEEKQTPINTLKPHDHGALG